MSNEHGNGGAIRRSEGRGRLYDSIIDTVGDTPCVRINRLSPEGVTIYAKSEFFNPAGSVKDRLALNIIEAAERDGSLKPGQTVIEATSGNTGLGLAMVCAAKGYPLVVTMADSFSVERRQLMRYLGAKVVLTPRAEKGIGMYIKARDLAEKHGWFQARQFETSANADMHENTTAREIMGDFAGGRLDYFVSGFGTGGTLTGVARVRRSAPARRSSSRSRQTQRSWLQGSHRIGTPTDRPPRVTRIGSPIRSRVGLPTSSLWSSRRRWTRATSIR